MPRVAQAVSAGVVILLIAAGALNPAFSQTNATSGSGLKEAVAFTAQDSLVVSLSSGDGDLGTLFGQATVTYSDAALGASRIDILFDQEELFARGSPSDSGMVGRPVFRQGEEEFTGDELSFNMRSERGRVVGAQTRIQEGFIRADIVKAAEDSTLYIRNGVYTTCNCVEDPSYSLRSSRMKIVNQKWIFTGPIQLYLFNIPTPLWLPFGFLPATDGRRSGPLPPSYGEDEFGFYLRDWGWYFALNDYTDLQLQAGIWTRGSFEAKSLFRYRRRYRFNGQTMISYARFRSGESGDPDFSVRKTGSFRWNHSQTVNPTTNFDANVNLSSSGYLRGVSQNYSDRVTQTIQSSIRYSKRWSSRSLSVNANQRQVVESGAVSLTFPNVTFSQSSFKPFERSVRPPGSSERFYEKLTMSYSFAADNRFDFNPLTDEALLAAGDTTAAGIDWIDALLSQDDFTRATGDEERFAFKASHRIPISAPFSVNRVPLLGGLRMNLSPNLSYTEDWYARTERQALNDSTGAVERSSLPGFFALRQFTASVSASSVFYGLFPLRLGAFSGLRHTVRPSIGMGFRPDFYGDQWGYTRSYTDSNGDEQEYAIVSGVGRGSQQSLTFSLANTFETKRVAADSSQAPATATRALKLLDLNLASSFNFAADSLGFGTISLTSRTRILSKVDVDFRSSFSPYQTDESGATVNDYAFSAKTPLGRLTSASLTVRTSLRSSQSAGGRPLTSPRAGFSNARIDPGLPVETTLQNPFGEDTPDFEIPWSLGLDFTYGVSRSAFTSTRRAILNGSFDLSLTPNWKVTGRTGYDLERREMATTNLSLARDFDCWQMAMTWIPFGAYQSWGFDLHVKSDKLRDLLRIRQPKSDVQDRFGSLR